MKILICGLNLKSENMLKQRILEKMEDSAEVLFISKIEELFEDKEKLKLNIKLIQRFDRMLLTVNDEYSYLAYSFIISELPELDLRVMCSAKYRDNFLHENDILWMPTNLENVAERAAKPKKVEKETVTLSAFFKRILNKIR